MNYLKQYVKLIKKAKQRDSKELTGIYTENHHVFPRSIYGSTSLLVKLTYKEHLVAHHLLFLGFKQRYGLRNSKTCKMGCALNMMLGQKYRFGEDSDIISMAKAIKRSKKTRYTHSAETRKKLSEALKGVPHSPEAIKKRSESLKGRIVTEETRRKISEAQIGKIIPEELKIKLAEMGRGENNSHYDPTLRHWYNQFSGEVVRESTILMLRKDHPETLHSRINGVVQGKIPHYKGWIIIDLPLEASNEEIAAAGLKIFKETIHHTDHTLRDWYNEKTGATEYQKTTKYMVNTHGLNQGNASAIVKGKRRMNKGWILLNKGVDIE